MPAQPAIAITTDIDALSARTLGTGNSRDQETSPMASSFGKLTLICLEIPWTEDFGQDADFTPECAVAPYLDAFAVNSGIRFLLRHVHTRDDWSRWCRGLKHKRLGRRVHWGAAHGDGKGNKAHIDLLPTRGKKGAAALFPKDIKGGLAVAGKLDGVIIDACDFGRNDPATWLPGKNTTFPRWALAFDRPVLWTDSTFFALKTLEWLLETNPSLPTTSAHAARRFKDGVVKGRVKKRSERVDLSAWAAALGARFYYRKQNKGWDVICFPQPPGA